MNALLGRITKIRKLKVGRSARPPHRLEVSFKAACVLPERTIPPTWLKDQVLKVTRRVADPREIGGVGDGIALTPKESADWLFPLRVEPQTTRGNVPAAIRITLHWWKDKKPPEYTISANGRSRAGRLVRRGKAFSASASTRGLFDAKPNLPVQIRITLDQLTSGCTVLPSQAPFHAEVRTRYGVRRRVESDWYALDVCGETAGGGISMLRERGRDVDHFESDADRAHLMFEHAGHCDRVA